MRWLSSCGVIGLVLAYVVTRQRQQAIQAVPTAEHKKQWDTNTQWTGTSWE